MKGRALMIVSLISTAMGSWSTAAHAGFTFLGPTPYRSAADSPFNLSRLGTTFFLEDFEDFQANTPGLDVVSGGGYGLGSSVDGDDGLIDGFGNLGHSVNGTAIQCTFASCIYEVSFSFNTTVSLGFFPTAVGVVLTSGAGANTDFRFFDTLGGETLVSIQDLTQSRFTTVDNRFIGIINPAGITGFSFRRGDRRIGPSDVLVIDHIQYGLYIPEPSSIVLAGLALARYSGRGFLPSFL